MNNLPDFDRVGDLLRGVPGPSTHSDTGSPGSSSSDLSRGPSGDLSRRVAAVWAEVVGPEVAANSRPVQLRSGRLVVSASSSAWAQSLQLMSEAIVARLNERMGPDLVERAVFRHAGWEEQPERPSRGAARPRRPEEHSSKRPTASPQALTGEQEDVLAAVERLDVSLELREKMIRAMKAAFVRAQQDSVR